jgi:membrane protein implicated in regulation of membrane protease activity
MECVTTVHRAVFRLPAASVLLPVLVMLCVTPLATAGGTWAILFVLPIVLLAYIVYTRTVADPQRLTVHTLLGRRQMAWADTAGLEFHDSRWAIAVGSDGTRMRLPMVRPRDLPRLVAVSGGSLTLDHGPDAPPSPEQAAPPDETTPPPTGPPTIASGGPDPGRVGPD